MLEFLINLDQTIFYFINVSLSNPVTDLVMPIITSDMWLRILYAVSVALLLWKGDARVRWLVLFSALVLLFTDQSSSGLLKPLIDRPRPCHVLENINLLVGCGGGKAMPSSHAANAFGQAVLFSFYFRKAAPYLLIFASLVALSRVFVGVHYPG
ncbi:MAG: phosphatase PAP2 family protein, partial [bacterium]|nr:phosphatase PAP2 family protein [bacterium]